MIVDISYWFKVLKKILITILTIASIYLVFRLAMFYLPFLIAFIISFLLEPIIKFIMKKFKFSRKYSAIFILIFIIIVLLGITILVSSTLFSESSSFLNNLNEYVEMTVSRIQDFKIIVQNWNIPENILIAIENSSTDLINLISNFLKNALIKGMNLISAIPVIAMYFAITAISLYFLCTDKVYMIDQLEHHLPETWVKKIYRHTKDISKSLGSYLKAQIILINISFVIVLLGLFLIKIMGFNIKYPLLYALGIGFVDALPIFGSGTVMIPWSIASALYGDIRLGIAILTLWTITTIIRQVLEPRIVGKHIGIHPIFTLIAMYTGFRAIGLTGLLLGPIILIISKSIFSSMIDNGFLKSIFEREIQ